MKNRIITLFILCIIACLPTVVLADAPIADGVYYISCTQREGYVGLGAYHNVSPFIYYVTDVEEVPDDAYWVVVNTRSGYTFRNEVTDELLVFTYDRNDSYYKYMTLSSEAPDDGSQYWNIIEGSDGAFCVQSKYDTDYYWNLRTSSTNLLGTYSGSGGNGANERYVFYEKGDTPYPPIGGEHEYVDLGLPSGTLWATCNIGANSPEEYGDYFAWGETKPKKSNGSWGDYSWETYKWMNSGQADWTQINKYTFADSQTEACWYNSNGTFIGDGQTELFSEDDVATANWGSEWQMPSMFQMYELFNSENTTSTWTTVNGMSGQLVTSRRNGSSIFLPAAGRLNDIEFAGTNGYYWSRVLNDLYSDHACILYFNEDKFSVSRFDRCSGLSVRPVRVEKKTDSQFPSDEYTPFEFPQALHVYLSDGRCEAYPLMYVTNYTEQGGRLLIETNLNWTYTYNLSQVDSVTTQRPEFPFFETFKFTKKYNDQLFGTAAEGVVDGDTITATVLAIGKRLTPTFTVSDEDVDVYLGEKLQKSKESRLRFDKDVYYLVAKSGYKILTPEADNKYFLKPYGRCVRVHVDWPTDRAEVPTIYINTADGTYNDINKSYYEDATITIDGHDIFPSMEETAVQIKGRGNSSWNWPKKPYRLKFETGQKPLGMTKGKSWVLLSNYQTGSLMSNAIGMKAANLMGAAAANHIIPVDLYLNGEYRGSYNLTEKVGFSNNSVELPDETSAALLELDSYYDEPDGQKFRSSPYNLPINIKEPDFSDPDTETNLTLDIISRNFNNFMSALYRGKDISRYVDIEQLCRFMMVNELTLNYEFYHPKSTFCYRESFVEDSCKYIFGPVWDLDWCFGYENNGNYFRNESTANYWKDMNKMEVADFVRDLRWKYEPLNDVYTELWEQFMQNDLQDLLEYCQDYYDFAHNSFDANRSVWGDRTDYAQQAQQAASWLETRTQKIYEDIINGVRPELSEPVEPVEFANDKLYTIACERGALVLSADQTHLTTEQQRWDAEEEEFQFAIITIEGQNYIYSPVTKQYLSYIDHGTWVNQLGTPITIDPSRPYKEGYLYMMSCTDDYGQTLYFNHNTSVLVINTFSTPDPGNRFAIEEVGDFDPTEALELASQSLFAVTNNYIFNGEIVGSEVRQMPYGSEPPAPSSQWTNAFVELEEPDDMPYQIEGETTIDYEVKWNGPFFFSTSFDDAYWYNMTIRSDYFVGRSKSEPYYPSEVDEETLLYDSDYYWAFGGDPYHVKVYNYSTGFDQTLTAVGDYGLMRAGDYAWDLLPNRDGFLLRKPGTTNSCLNQFGGVGGPLKFWVDDKSLTDNGSTFRIFEANASDINVVAAGQPEVSGGAYNLAGQRVGERFKGIVIRNGKKVLVK